MNVAPALRDFLRPHEAPTLGGRRATRNEVLVTELKAVGQRNHVYYVVCFAALLLLLIGAAAMVVLNLVSIGTVRAVFAVLGLSMSGLVAQMAALWRQKVLADTLVAVAGHVDRGQLKAVAEAVLAKLAVVLFVTTTWLARV